MKKAWLLFAALLVNGIVHAATSNLVKRQQQDGRCRIDFRLGPNNETILTSDGADAVYLTGNNAMKIDVAAGEMVSSEIINVPGGQSIRVDIATNVSTIRSFVVQQYIVCQCQRVGDPAGPGCVYTSAGQAFFINDGCVDDLMRIGSAIANAPGLRTEIRVVESMDAGQPVSNIQINDPMMGGFEMTITGAMPVTVGAGQSISYSSGTLSIPGTSFSQSGISNFATVAAGSRGVVEFNQFDNTQTANIGGPGTAYVGGNQAVFIGDFGSDIQNINQMVVSQTFEFMSSATGDATIVTDRSMNNIIMLTGETNSFRVEGGSSGTYDSDMVTFSVMGGRMFSFGGVSTFSVYDNNRVMTNPSSFSVATGGTVISSPETGSAIFVTDSNPAAVPMFQMSIPMPPPTTYTIEQNSDRVRMLMRTTGSPPETMSIQTITGSYVMPVDSSETVVYMDSEIQIQGFNGMPNVIIENVNEFFTDSSSNPERPNGNFSMVVPAAFRGPGVISYSRGTGFYTDNPELGNMISFQSGTAPVPRITFGRTDIGTNLARDGVNYTVQEVGVMIGGDTAITFESTSYTTTPDQQIVYSGNMVTVHTPRIVGEGTVRYNGGAQRVTYTDGDGNEQIIPNIATFNQFSGGDITTTMSGNDATAQGPGRIYVSEDGTQATFSNSPVITDDVAMLIRGSPTDYQVPADQLSTVISGTYNRSMMAATVVYPGGGVLWSSTSNVTGINNALYLDDAPTMETIYPAIASLLLTTKSVPAKDTGVLDIIFNGKDVYSYSPVDTNNEFLIPPSGTVNYINGMISGNTIPGGPFMPYDRITIFDGVEVRQINSSDMLQTLDGPGYILLPMDSTEAFFTNYPPTIRYLASSIQILRAFLTPPMIRPGRDTITSKSSTPKADFGDRVTVFETADVELTCNVVRGRPTPSVAFFRVTPMGRVRLNDSDANVMIVNNKLTLLNVDMADAGVYQCEASNGVPENARVETTLAVRERVPPMLQPGWFPFPIGARDKLIFPDEPIIMENVILNEFDRLVLSCRFDGQPKAQIEWRFNDRPINDDMFGLPNDSYVIFDDVEGRSALILDLANSFNETDSPNQLLGTNTFTCRADQVDALQGEVEVTGTIIMCDPLEGTEPCSTTCGFGTRPRSFSCNQFNAVGMSTVISIDDVPLTIVPAIDRIQSCTTVINAMGDMAICPLSEFQWVTSNWTECSKTCGGGSQNRNVSCQRLEYPIDSRYNAQIMSVNISEAENTMCAMSTVAGPRPVERQLCNEERCPFFQIGMFGPCSATCGDSGIRMRSVDCVELIGKYVDMNGKTRLNVTIVNDSLCHSMVPEEVVECNRFPCFYQWLPRAFGECGETSLLEPPVESEFSCREREIDCVDEFGMEVNDSFCEEAGLVKPSAFSSCGGGNCFVGIWNINTPYSNCSASCGYGIQTREPICYSPESFTPVPGVFCDPGTKPPTMRNCFIQNCPNMCLRDESSVCPILAMMNMCDSAFAMGNDGLRCCVSCGMGAGGD